MVQPESNPLEALQSWVSWANSGILGRLLSPWLGMLLAGLFLMFLSSMLFDCLRWEILAAFCCDIAAVLAAVCSQVDNRCRVFGLVKVDSIAVTSKWTFAQNTFDSARIASTPRTWKRFSPSYFKDTLKCPTYVKDLISNIFECFKIMYLKGAKSNIIKRHATTIFLTDAREWQKCEIHNRTCVNKRRCQVWFDIHAWIVLRGTALHCTSHHITWAFDKVV